MISLRRAKASDCPRMLELVRELAEFERAPNEVTVTLDHFIQAGFGPDPVWKALVAVVDKAGNDKPVADEHADEQKINDNHIVHEHANDRGANGGDIVGISLWYIRYSTWKGRRLYLEDLIVTESYRGKGIGKLLFDATVEEARKMQYGGMMWQVLDWNEAAISFYKKYGTSFDGEWVNCSLNFDSARSVGL